MLSELIVKYIIINRMTILSFHVDNHRQGHVIFLALLFFPVVDTYKCTAQKKSMSRQDYEQLLYIHVCMKVRWSVKGD